jgi:hypothetical protein
MSRHRLSALAGEVTATALTVVRAGALEIGLRWLPLPSVASAFGATLAAERGCRPSARCLDLRDSERRHLRAITRVMRRWRFCRGVCLRSALLTAHALRERRPLVVVGVRRAHADIGAHAWVEVDGVRLGSHLGYLRLDAGGRAAA